MAKKKNNSLSLKNFTKLSPAKQLLLFIAAFILIGGGYYVYKSNANPLQYVDENEDSYPALTAGSLSYQMTSQDEKEVEANMQRERDEEEVERRAGNGDGDGIGGLRDEIIKTAKAEKGSNDWKKYVNGGTCGGSKKKWCTSFVSWLYNQNYSNYKIKKTDPCSSDDYMSAGASRKIDKRMKRGDTLIKKGHTGIFLNKKDNGDICSIDGNWDNKVSEHCSNKNYWDKYYPLTARDLEKK